MATPGVGSRPDADARTRRHASPSAAATRLVRGRAVVLGAALALGCGDSARTEALVVGAALPRALLERAERAFEASHPTVDVRFSTLSPEETLDALRADRGAVDVWWGARDRLLVTAAAEGLLRPYRPAWADSVEPALAELDAQGRWHAAMRSPWVLAFDREEVELVRAPRDWIDLFHLRWTGEVVLADPTRAEDAADFVAAMALQGLREDGDLLAGFDRLARLDGQIRQYAVDHADAVRRLGTREARIALLPRHVAEATRRDVAPWLHYRTPESGTPALLRGVAVTAGSSAPELAGRFVDWLGSAEAAIATKLVTHWEPAAGRVDSDGLPDDFEIPAEWSALAPAPDTLAAEHAGWLERWSLEVRGLGAR